MMKRDCIGKFDESSEICLAGCRDCKECAEKSNIKFDEKIKAKIDWKKGKITLKEMTKIVWGIKDNPKPREESNTVKIPFKITPIKTPKVAKTVQDRMQWINN